MSGVTVGTLNTSYPGFGLRGYTDTYVIRVNKLGNIEVAENDRLACHTFHPDDIDTLCDYLKSAAEMAPAVVAAHHAAEEATRLAEEAKQAVLEKIARGGN